MPDRFECWTRGGVARGQRQLAESLRVLIYKAAPDLFDGLDFEDDSCFLDPLLFAYFTNPAPTVPLAQLLYARLAPERRPASLRLRTDDLGRIFVPGRGDLRLEVFDREVDLHEDARSGRLLCSVGDGALPARWVEPLRIPRTGIEVFRYPPPLLGRFLTEGNGSFAGVEVAGVTRRHFRHLCNAFAIMSECCPALAEEISATTRRVVLYRGPSPNSFATLSAHGAVFFNVPEDADEVFFLDDMAHQCAHVMFNALTLDKQRFLTVDPKVPLRAVCRGTRDPRTVYSAFHGLFTYVTICRVLSACGEGGAFGGRQAHELLGRLGMTLRKFESDLALLASLDVFTATGRLCHRRFADQHRDYWARYGAKVAPLDFSNQPYVFSYPRFAESNLPAGSPGLARAVVP